MRYNCGLRAVNTFRIVIISKPSIVNLIFEWKNVSAAYTRIHVIPASTGQVGTQLILQ